MRRAQKAKLDFGVSVQAAELSNNVEALLVAVKATNDFEQEMAKRFGGGSGADSVADEVCSSALRHMKFLADQNPTGLLLLHVRCCSLSRSSLVASAT